MQFQISALKEGRFKKPVTMSVPSEKLNDAGQTIYHKAHFFAEYINVSESDRETYQKSLDELNRKIEALPDEASFEEGQKLKKALEKLQHGFTQKFLVGIEKHKKHPFPFLDGEKEFKDITVLLGVRLFREAVNDAYEDEVNRNQKEKLKGLLGGNLPK